MTAEQRRAICTEALSWRKTPFRNNANIKGVGVDCAQLIAEVARNCGILPADFKLEPYNYQHALHSSEPLYENYLKRYMDLIQESEVLPGDVVLYRAGRVPSHSGIIIEWPTKIVHAVRFLGGVCESHGLTDAAVQGRPRLFFTFR